jgi:hypothetical protein
MNKDNGSPEGAEIRFFTNVLGKSYLFPHPLSGTYSMRADKKWHVCMGMVL